MKYLGNDWALSETDQTFGQAFNVYRTLLTVKCSNSFRLFPFSKPCISKMENSRGNQTKFGPKGKYSLCTGEVILTSFGAFPTLDNLISRKKTGLRTKLIKIWTSGVLTWCRQRTFDWYVFIVSLRSFSAFPVFNRITQLRN